MPTPYDSDAASGTRRSTGSTAEKLRAACWYFPQQDPCQSILCRWGTAAERRGQIRPSRTAKCMSAAVDCTWRCSIMRYLWKAIVRGDTLRIAAACFIEWPSASSCSTSRWRGVSWWIGLRASCGWTNEPTRSRVSSGVRRGRSLQEIRGRADAECFRRDIGILVHREEDDACRGQHAAELAGSVEPVQRGHRNIEEGNVGPQSRDIAQEGARVVIHADDVTVRLKQSPEGFRHQDVIVDDHHTRPGHGNPLHQMPRRPVPALPNCRPSVERMPLLTRVSSIRRL